MLDRPGAVGRILGEERLEADLLTMSYHGLSICPYSLQQADSRSDSRRVVMALKKSHGRRVWIG